MKFSKFFLLLGVAATCFAPISCGDDDGGSSGGGNPDASGTGTGSNTSGLLKDGNILLQSLNGNRFFYDDLNRLITCQYGYDAINFDYENNKLTMTGDENWDYNVSFNSDGCITKMNGRSYWEDSEDYDEITSVVNLSYDSQGHLTKLTEEGTYKEVYEGETEKWNYRLSASYEWQSGKLVKITQTGTDGEADMKYVATINYGNTANPYKQIPASFIDIDLFNCQAIYDAYFACTGLYGKGPDVLPSSLVYEGYSKEPGYKETYKTECTYRYTMNSSNRAIQNEAWTEKHSYSDTEGDNESYTSDDNFSYTYVGVNSSAAAPALAPRNYVEKPAKRLSLRERMIKRHRERRAARAL